MIEKLEALFQSLAFPWGYVFLFVSAYIENIFPPLPGDTFVVIGAFLVSRQHMTFFPAYLSTLMGSLLGFMTFYAVGRRWGRAWFQGKHGRFFSTESLDRVEKWFGRYGDWVLVFNRFLSGFRSVVSFTAGIARMDARKVFLYAFVSCALWNGILMGLGLLVGANWTVIVENYQRIVLGVLIILVIVWWVRAARKKRQ